MNWRVFALALGFVLLVEVETRATGAQEPAQFGAIGDGRTHPIGTSYGATLTALAGYTAAGIKPFAWVNDSIYGLAFSRSTQVGQANPDVELRFAGIAGPLNAGAQIILPGMTASATCLPLGDTVQSVALSGVIRLAQRSQVACGAGTPISFSLSPTQVQRLQADWLGIQSAVAAVNLLRTGGAVHIPQGDYLIDRPVVMPGGIRDTYAVVPEVDAYGDGLAQTRIVFVTDLGPGVCGFGETNRGVGSTTRASIHDLRLIGPGRRGSLGASPAGMDGFCIGAKELLSRVRADGFHAGANVLEDHWKIEGSEFANNLYGIYLAPGGDTFGNGVLRDVHPGGNLLAAVAIAASNVLDSATVENVDMGFVPYGFYREAAPAGSGAMRGFISNSLLENVWGESIGNSYIYGENGERDRVDHNTWIGDAPVMDVTGQYRLADRPAEAVAVVGAWVNNNMVNSDFGNPANYDVVRSAIMEAESEIQGNDFGRAADMVVNSSLTKPALRSQTLLFNQFSTGQAEGRWMIATDSLRAGEVVAEAGYDRAGPVVPGQVLAGVAMAPADAGGAIPVCDHGVVSVGKPRQVAFNRGDRVSSASDGTGLVVPANNTVAFATVWQDAPKGALNVSIVIGSLVH